jgi:hypothetical protein
MAMLLDPSEPEVRDAAQSAREIFVRLEAAPFIVRLDAATASAAGASAPAEAIRETARVATVPGPPFA